MRKRGWWDEPVGRVVIGAPLRKGELMWAVTLLVGIIAWPLLLAVFLLGWAGSLLYSLALGVWEWLPGSEERRRKRAVQYRREVLAHLDVTDPARAAVERAIDNP